MAHHEDYPAQQSGETLREYRIGYIDQSFGETMDVPPVVVGPFSIATANYYLDNVFARLRALPVTGAGVQRRWQIGMRDTSPTGDFPPDSVIKWPPMQLPALPVEEANALANTVVLHLKEQPGWGGGR